MTARERANTQPELLWAREMVREGLRFTAQAFQQMSVPQRTAVMTATLRDIEASLVDAALSLFEGLIGPPTHQDNQMFLVRDERCPRVGTPPHPQSCRSQEVIYRPKIRSARSDVSMSHP
jgi:hypothetical protein